MGWHPSRNPPKPEPPKPPVIEFETSDIDIEWIVMKEKQMDETKYSEEWAEIGTSVLNEFAEKKFKSIIELGISIGYVLSEDAPERNGMTIHAECIPVKKDHQRQFNPHDYLIKIYGPNVDYMTDEQKRILMEHELMHIHAYENKDGDTKIGVNPHDVQDFKDIIEKYGVDWDKNVHQQMTLDDLAEDEEEDADEEADTESDIDEEEESA